MHDDKAFEDPDLFFMEEQLHKIALFTDDLKDWTELHTIRQIRSGEIDLEN